MSEINYQVRTREFPERMRMYSVLCKGENPALLLNLFLWELNETLYPLTSGSRELQFQLGPLHQRHTLSTAVFISLLQICTKY